MPAETYRIARYLARCGVASRRKAEAIIQEGRVTLNGEVVKDLGRQVDPIDDEVTVDGTPIKLLSHSVTLATYKKRGVLVTRNDQHERRTIFDELPIDYLPIASRLTYAGRLDYVSEGLLILSTDGDFVNLLTHPSHYVEKEYLVSSERELSEAELVRLRGGMRLADGNTQPARVERNENKDRPIYRMIIREGKNRQIRRMFEALGHQVTRLVRVRIGNVQLNNLRPGQWRELSRDEMRGLFDDA